MNYWLRPTKSKISWGGNTSKLLEHTWSTCFFSILLSLLVSFCFCHIQCRRNWRKRIAWWSDDFSRTIVFVFRVLSARLPADQSLVNWRTKSKMKKKTRSPVTCKRFRTKLPRLPCPEMLTNMDFQRQDLSYCANEPGFGWFLTLYAAYLGTR